MPQLTAWPLLSCSLSAGSLLRNPAQAVASGSNLEHIAVVRVTVVKHEAVWS